MNKLKNYSLKHRVLLLTIIVSTVMSTIFTFASVLVDFRMGVKKMDENINRIELTTLGSLKGALWDLNFKLIKVQLNDLLRLEGIVDIRLMDENNKVIYKNFNAAARNALIFESFEKKYPLNFMIDDEMIYGGQLVIEFSREYIYRDVLRRAIIVFITQAFKTFFVSFILIFIYERLITKDLIKIANALKNFDVKTTEEGELFDEKRDSNDEISLIQSQLESMSSRLASVNRENNKLIEQANLEKKLQEAKALNAARLASLGEMAAGIAHEINNPLTIVKGSVFSISKKLRNEDSIPKEYLEKTFEKIDRAVERITKIIRNMKKVSRDSALEDIQQVNLKSLIEDTLEYYNEKFRKLDIDFTVDYTKNPDVIVREVELSQVLTNILNNCNDAISELRDKWIQVEVKDDEENAFIIITDSGAGITEDLEEKIFNPFFTTKDIGKGTGLGLSISKEAMRKMDGDIYLNRNSENTQFVVKIKKVAV